MSKKLFNRDFNKSGVDYIFSFNLFVMSERLNPKDESVEIMKQFDGTMVYPFEEDDILFGRADLCGFIIRPQWCYPEKVNSGRRPKSSRFYSRNPRRPRRQSRPIRTSSI